MDRPLHGADVVAAVRNDCEAMVACADKAAGGGHLPPDSETKPNRLRISPKTLSAWIEKEDVNPAVLAGEQVIVGPDVRHIFARGPMRGKLASGDRT